MTYPEPTKDGRTFPPRTYYAAVNEDMIPRVARHHKHVLIPWDTTSAEEVLRQAAAGARILVDSGVFSIASAYATKLKLPINRVFTLQPEDVPGFEKFFLGYSAFVREVQDKVDGCFEVDFGGMARKRELRAQLEADGCRVIPVFHFVTDTWDYLEELAEQYPHVAVGNTAKAGRRERVEVLRRVELLRARTGTRFHVLGVGMTDLAFAFGFDTFDSSEILRNCAYGLPDDYSCMRRIGLMVDELRSRRGTQDHYLVDELSARCIASQLCGLRRRDLALGEPVLP